MKKLATAKIIDKYSELIEFSCGSLTVWTVGDYVIAFKGNIHNKPIVCDCSETVKVAGYVLAQIDGGHACRYKRTDFDKLLKIVLTSHNLLE